MRWLGVVLTLMCAASAVGQDGPIDPTWVYVSPIVWKHAPKGIDEREGFAVVSVLFPEGRYVEVQASLIQMDKTKRVGFSAGDGTLIRGGTWARTDDHVIRLHSRNVFRDDYVFLPPYCGREICGPTEPGPFREDTCALEGESKTHLAKAIRCKRMSFAPLKLDLDLDQLAIYAKTRLIK